MPLLATSRRGSLVFFVGALLLAACAPASAPAPGGSAPGGNTPGPAALAASATAPAAAATDWSAVLAAAKQEGVVQCACPPRPDYTRLFKENFERAYPDIRLEASPATFPDIWARVEKEQDVGQYLWDVYMFGPTVEMFGLKNKGGFESFRDYMVGPDIGSESVWAGGWDAAFLDREKRYVFAYWSNVSSNITINRDLLPTAQIHTFAELVRPDYRGKIVWQDPRLGGIGVAFLTAAYYHHGPDAVKQLLIDQQPMLVRGNVEVTEQVLRGGRGISIGTVSDDTLGQYRDAGIRLNLEDVNLDDMPAANNSGQAPAVFKNPPHPNATRVFVNWLMSAPVQELLAREMGNNSTRQDITPPPSNRKPQPGVQYYHTQTEDAMTQVTAAAQRLARELVP